MLKKMCFIMGFFILAFPLLSQRFDCNKPDLGARIEDQKQNGKKCVQAGWNTTIFHETGW
jgi:hypothetical protein